MTSWISFDTLKKLQSFLSIWNVSRTSGKIGLSLVNYSGDICHDCANKRWDFFFKFSKLSSIFFNLSSAHFIFFFLTRKRTKLKVCFWLKKNFVRPFAQKVRQRYQSLICGICVFLFNCHSKNKVYDWKAFLELDLATKKEFTHLQQVFLICSVCMRSRTFCQLSFVKWLLW